MSISKKKKKKKKKEEKRFIYKIIELQTKIGLWC